MILGTSAALVAVVILLSVFAYALVKHELYSRLVYSGHTYTHLRAAAAAPDTVVTIMGPSKTESLSGYRLGVAFGPAHLIDRMEKLQAIVSLRAPGYSQAVILPASDRQSEVRTNCAIKRNLDDVRSRSFGR